MPDARSAVGLSVLASAASGFFGNTDFAANDFEPGGLPAWLDLLAAPARAGERDPVGTLVTTRGKYTSVGDIAASVRARQVEVLEPAPIVVATVVLIPLRHGDDLPDPAPLRGALVAAGWEASQPDVPSPTLKPGVLAALLTLWLEVTR